MALQIRVARNAGFCFGVERAIRMAKSAKPVADGPLTYILGALVHNPLVTAKLTQLGFVHVDSHESVQSGRVVLPSHGVTPSVRKSLIDRGIDVIDATCPFVARAQQFVEELSRSGRRVIIVGDRGHREVVGLAGHSATGVEIISSVEESVELFSRLPLDSPVAVISQTTQDQVAFELIVRALKSRFTDIVVKNTICTATSDRQQGVIELASQVDMMIVVGGRNSANTRRLYEISRSLGVDTCHIESADELDEVVVASGSRIGIAAGASTPGWAIKEVVNKMEEKTKGLNGELEGAMTSEGAGLDQANANEAEQATQVVGQPEQTESAAPQDTDAVPAQEQDGIGGASDTDESGQLSASTVDGELESGQAVEDVESTPEADQVEVPQEAPSEDVTTMTEALKSEYVPQEGEIIKGKVVQIGDNEVLVDIGYKSEAVIPVKELSVRPVDHPSEAVQVGDEIHCVVLSVDIDEERSIVVSKKRADLIQAWERVETAFNEGTTVEGKVVDVVKGGVTVDIGLRGFVPASQIALRPVADLRSVLGQTLTMKVLEVEKERNNVVLSQRAYLEERLAEAKKRIFETVKEGDLVLGTVTRLTNFGAFVDIGDGVEGLLHVSDISWNRIGHPGQVLKEGDQIKVMVLNMDPEKERISLGLKQTQDDPWTKVPTKYPVGTVTDGKITRLTDFGAFVELEPGIEGLVHVSQISRERVEKPSDVLKEGQTVQVKVISLRQDQRRIGLSIREVEDEFSVYSTGSTARTKSNSDEPSGGATIGELVGDILKQHNFTLESSDESDSEEDESER